MPKYAFLTEGQTDYLRIWTNDPNAVLTYNVYTASGTAQPWSDYEPIQTYGTVVGGINIPVRIIDDDRPEPEETFRIYINADASDGSQLTDYLEVTIYDNDTYKCFLDFDNDGQFDKVELSYSALKDAIAEVRLNEAQALTSLLLADQALSGYAQESTWLKVKGALQLADFVGSIAGMGVSKAWKTALAVGKAVIALRDYDLDHPVKQNVAIMDGFREVLTYVENVSSASVATAVLAKDVIELIIKGQDILATKNALVALSENVAIWQQRQMDLTQKVSQFELQLEQLENCFAASPFLAASSLIEGEASWKGDVDCGCGAGAARTEAQPMASAEDLQPGLRFLTQADDPLLPDWLQMGIGSEVADDLVITSTATEPRHFLLMLRGGGDTVEHAGGSLIIDGGDGLDKLYLRFGSSEADVEKTNPLKASDRVFQVAHDGDLIVLENVERVHFDDNVAIAFDIDGVAGQGYRLYQAAFDRVPDTPGLSFWVRQLDAGMSLKAVAQAFIDSPEFQSLYGPNPSNAVFLELLYENVLDRAPDAGGYSYWLGAMGAGLDRKDMLIEFSESPENQMNVIGAIDNGIWLV